MSINSDNDINWECIDTIFCEGQNLEGRKLLIGTKRKDSIGSVKLNFLFFDRPGYNHQICQTQVILFAKPYQY